MLEDMRKYVRSGLAEQLSAFASGFLEWSAEARASLLQEVKDLVARQIEAMGVATKDDVEALRTRIDRLEARGAAKTATRRTSTTRKAGSAKKATSRSSSTARSRSASAARSSRSPRSRRSQE